MAHFFGSVKGTRSECTRLGTKNSGLTTVAASYSGAIKVILWEHEKGETYTDIFLIPWEGFGETKMIYRGSLKNASGLCNQCEKKYKE